jgi:predicted Zn-dependent peptidase
MTTSHIEEATLDDVKSFFYSHYAPNNAILTVTGNVEPEEVYRLAQKWFGPIPARSVPVRNLPAEPIQDEHRILEVQRNVPNHHLLMAFHMCSRTNEKFHAADLLSDILSNGASSRLNQNLVKKSQLFTEINAYISGDDEPGLFIVTGRINPGITFEEAEAAVWQELNVMTESKVEDYELQKVKNKVEANLIYSEVSFLNKAMSLAHFELQGDAGAINEEPLKYRKVTPSCIQKAAIEIFRKNNCNTVRYFSQNTTSN